MGEYIGLDVSLKETAVSVRGDGKRVWRGKCASDPQLLAALIRKRDQICRQRWCDAPISNTDHAQRKADEEMTRSMGGMLPPGLKL